MGQWPWDHSRSEVPCDWVRIPGWSVHYTTILTQIRILFTGYYICETVLYFPMEPKHTSQYPTSRTCETLCLKAQLLVPCSHTLIVPSLPCWLGGQSQGQLGREARNELCPELSSTCLRGWACQVYRTLSVGSSALFLHPHWWQVSAFPPYSHQLSLSLAARSYWKIHMKGKPLPQSHLALPCALQCAEGCIPGKK